MNCECGFKFAGPREFRNCETFITGTGRLGVTCPTCNTSYVDGMEIKLEQKDEA